MTLDQVRHRPTIPPTVQTGGFSWFRHAEVCKSAKGLLEMLP
jgi:hypothetical protein